ncbi:MAG: GNAT family N-acetyltransferase [Candidatus Lokiarchaeota archaeon]
MAKKRKTFSKKIQLKKRLLHNVFFQIEKEKEHGTISESEEKLLQEGMVYRQMRLPVEKITPEFEAQMKQKIEHNIYQAHIREATEKDLNIVVNIYNKSWLTSNTPFRPMEKETLKKIFVDPDTVFLIARIFGIDSAFVILDHEGIDKEYGVIAGLGVIPKFQRKGLGTVLGLATWDYFKKKGVRELRCEVYNDNNASTKFIEALGFEEFGQMVYRKEDFELEDD